MVKVIDLIAYTTIGVAAIMPIAKSQTLADAVVLQSKVMEKINASLDACFKKHQGVIDKAWKAVENAPSDQMNAALDRLDSVSKQKEGECGPLEDQSFATMKQLMQTCDAYTVSTVGNRSPATAADILAINICQPKRGISPAQNSN